MKTFNVIITVAFGLSLVALGFYGLFTTEEYAMTGTRFAVCAILTAMGALLIGLAIDWYRDTNLKEWVLVSGMTVLATCYSYNEDTATTHFYEAGYTEGDVMTKQDFLNELGQNALESATNE